MPIDPNYWRNVLPINVPLPKCLLHSLLCYSCRNVYNNYCDLKTEGPKYLAGKQLILKQFNMVIQCTTKCGKLHKLSVSFKTGEELNRTAANSKIIIIMFFC